MTQHPPEHRDPRPLRLGFARGIAPRKWAKRWAVASPGHPLELVPLELASGSAPDAPVDVLLERAAPGERPVGADEPHRTRHALQLYTEAVALVVETDHELAESGGIDVADLTLVTLLDHPGHSRDWPDPEPWADPAWMPVDVPAALELVATGAGAILLPLPLARHLVRKRDHVVLPVTGTPELPGSTVWATWETARDAADVQQLVGILRGRTARSSRPDAASDPVEAEGAGHAGHAGHAGGAGRDPQRAAAARKPQKTGNVKKTGKAALKPNSRGAQLAAARERAERKAAARRQEKRKRR